jgi:glycine cleavage system H lipoate-binding protein
MSRAPFRGAVPDGLLYDPDHDMWVRREGEEVVIGASAFGIFLAGEIIAFTAKPKGAPKSSAVAAWVPSNVPRPCSPCMRRFPSR